MGLLLVSLYDLGSHTIYFRWLVPVDCWSFIHVTFTSILCIVGMELHHISDVKCISRNITTLPRSLSGHTDFHESSRSRSRCSLQQRCLCGIIEMSMLPFCPLIAIWNKTGRHVSVFIQHCNHWQGCGQCESFVYQLPQPQSRDESENCVFCGFFTSIFICKKLGFGKLANWDCQVGQGDIDRELLSRYRSYHISTSICFTI